MVSDTQGASLLMWIQVDSMNGFPQLFSMLAATGCLIGEAPKCLPFISRKWTASSEPTFSIGSKLWL